MLFYHINFTCTNIIYMYYNICEKVSAAKRRLVFTDEGNSSISSSAKSDADLDPTISGAKIK